MVGGPGGLCPCLCSFGAMPADMELCGEGDCEDGSCCTDSEDSDVSGSPLSSAPSSPRSPLLPLRQPAFPVPRLPPFESTRRGPAGDDGVESGGGF